MKNIILITWKDTGEQQVYPTLTKFNKAYKIAPLETINNYISRKKMPYECGSCKIEKKKIVR